MGMNEILAAFYGTNGATEKTASAEDHEKAAQYELFTKLAASNGIDISKLSDAQVQSFYDETFSKQAGEMPPQFAVHAAGKKDEKDGKKDEKEEVEEKAKKEHEEKKAMAEKLAEADYIGRAIAHAYVQELGLIADNRAKTAAATEPKPGAWKVDMPKVASAIDQLAMPRAFAIIQEHNKTAAADAKIDEKTAAEKIVAVHAKGGFKDDAKVAAAADYKAAIEVRALETLEAAGYPVNWGG